MWGIMKVSTTEGLSMCHLLTASGAQPSKPIHEDAVIPVAH